MATGKFYLKNPKDGDSLKGTEVSIILKFTISRTERFEISTGEKIIPRYWDPKKQEAKSNYRKHVEINLELRRIKQDVIQLWRDNKALAMSDLRALAEPIVRTGQAAREEKKTPIEAVERFIAQYRLEKVVASTSKYKALLKRLVEFNTTYPLTFENLDFNFYDAFKNWLYKQPNPNYVGHSLVRDGDIFLLQGHTEGDRVGLFDEVVNKYFINFKTVLTWASERGYDVNPIFKKWPVSRKEYEVISLTHDELKRLESTTMSSPRLEIARDYLALECRTGQRISDLKRFNVADVKDNKWTLTQKKGNRIVNKVVTVPFAGYCQPAYWILQKYGFKMPEISEQNLNYAIKEACKEAGIDQEMHIDRWAGNKKIRIPGKKYEFISTHTGRKTFITIALQYMAPKLVMDLTGIRSFKTLKHYMGDSDVQEIEKQLMKIEDNQVLMKKAN